MLIILIRDFRHDHHCMPKGRDKPGKCDLVGKLSLPIYVGSQIHRITYHVLHLRMCHTINDGENCKRKIRYYEPIHHLLSICFTYVKVQN